MDGVILLHKEKGLSSFGALSRLKRKFPKKTKLGHAGTLDPMAAGLLICLVGKATRLMPYLASGMKSYEGTIQLGLRTETDDLEGDVLEVKPLQKHDFDLEAVKREFTGDLDQVPPAYSAKRIAGKRSYQLAREGKAVELKPCRVRIEELALEQAAHDILSFRLQCSKGTYIRSLARDIGDFLGTGACLASLIRTKSFPFDLTDASLVDEVSESSLLPWWVCFPKHPVVNLPAQSARRLSQGAVDIVSEELLRFAKSNEIKSGGLFLYSSEEEPDLPLGLLKANEGRSEIAINFDTGLS